MGLPTKYFFYLSLLFVTVVGCSKRDLLPPDSDDLPSLQDDGWQIDSGLLLGSGKPFPVYSQPAYVPISGDFYFSNNHRVLLYKSQNRILVFPLSEMNIECVNDKLDDIPFAITYCPRTKSAIGISRLMPPDTLTLTASGYLFKENMVPMDTATGRLWSQMAFALIKGDFSKNRLTNVPVFETIWGVARSYFPDAEVFLADNQDSIFSPPFAQNRDQNPLDAGGNTNPAILDGTRYFGILRPNHPIKLFDYSYFAKGRQIEVIEGKKRIIVWANPEYDIITAYFCDYPLQPLQDQFPNIAIDETGSVWNVFGEAVQGPRKGQRLAQPVSYFALGSAWKDFFSEIDFYE